MRITGPDQKNSVPMLNSVEGVNSVKENRQNSRLGVTQRTAISGVLGCAMPKDLQLQSARALIKDGKFLTGVNRLSSCAWQSVLRTCLRLNVGGHTDLAA